MRHLLTILAGASLSTLAFAQSFNLDVGMNLYGMSDVPSNAYGAAANQGGYWNPAMATGFALPLTLRDLGDLPTSVVVDSDVLSSYSAYPLPNLPIDDQYLLTDGQALAWYGEVATWTFTGLTDGDYLVYTYSYDVLESGNQTEIRLAGDPNSAQLVGGSGWLGSPHVLGITYALHSVTVVGGTFALEAESSYNIAGSVNAIQLVLTNGVEPGVGYCFGDPGSGTPCPCANDNDGSVPGSGCDNGVTSSGAKLVGLGLASVTTDSLVLSTTGLEPNNTGLYFQANNAVNGGHGNPFGDGLRCAGGGLVRLQIRIADATGSSHTTIPLALQGGVVAGDTKRYQCWYRTNQNPPCGAGVNDFNLSNGYEIVWQI